MADQYVLGMDLGTTSIKVVLLDIHSKTVTNSSTFPTNSDTSNKETENAKEQDLTNIIASLDQCLAALPKEKLNKVICIGVSGQMHGVMFWKSKTGCEWSGSDVGHTFRPKDVSQLITWQDGRCSSNFLLSLPKPQSHLSVATGFGCASIFWYTKHRPEFLSEFNVAGTVQDYVVSMLCGSEACVMTGQNAASWGYFSTTNNQWNMDILKGAGFPVHLLPELVESGSVAGQTCSEWHGIPANVPVGAALGDFQCSVYSCMKDRTDAGVQLSESEVYSTLVQCALIQPSTDLCVTPTLLGERHDPTRLGQVSNISPSSLSLGQVTRAICRGILANLASMMPPQVLLDAGVRRIMGSGSALTRNEVLKQEVEKVFPLPVVYGEDVDSAVGVAMIFNDRQ
ncbi:sedoheptulokinase isoform X2 [Hoplias malabaricus]|uniref:sedoheptulokinase isoform X2 n=1 Tax=Hoplias malabaricus TaxID=27720 RepID=UPI0034630490